FLKFYTESYYRYFYYSVYDLTYFPYVHQQLLILPALIIALCRWLQILCYAARCIQKVLNNPMRFQLIPTTTGSLGYQMKISSKQGRLTWGLPAMQNRLGLAD
ncbi:MAG: hypothetical protein ABW152_19780, partial [Candidatus Thiodiazotropha endolucinida]